MAIKSDPTTMVDENIKVVTRHAPNITKQLTVEQDNIVTPSVVKGFATPVIEGNVAASVNVNRYDLKQLLENIISWTNQNVSYVEKQKIAFLKDKALVAQLISQWLDRYATDLTWVRTSLTLAERQSNVNQFRDWLISSIASRY